MARIEFLDNNGTFTLSNPEMYHNLYFPIASELGIKSVVTPKLGGDSKLDQNTFLLEPVSIENLHNNKAGRNFWCKTATGAWSAVGNSAEAECNLFTEAKDKSKVTAGFLWHMVERESAKYGLASSVLSFVPWDQNVEIMQVTIKNIASAEQKVTPYAAIPMYGRSADNIRDHRHVTSLLHRIRTTECGVEVQPTLSFDERGHQKNEMIYYVSGLTAQGEKPQAFYPTVESFIGEAGSHILPEAVVCPSEEKNTAGCMAGATAEGCEAMGAFRFAETILAPGQSASYTILIGATKDETEITRMNNMFATETQVAASLQATKDYWEKKVNISVQTGDAAFDGYMRWVCLQPFLRRMYGCSFLPHHDYGRGGRGWRDLWQDCLALLIMDPSDVRKMIMDNFGGVRVDGTNATIIGSNPGEFIADRNGITRVWMDHGMWPFLTVKLYLEQTGDLNLLNEKTTYFKDRQVMRGNALDESFTKSMDCIQRGHNDAPYEGTVLEHLLLQHVCGILETGEHGVLRLRDADWNDALDMASKKGESVAFSCAYAGNMIALAGYVRRLKEAYGMETVDLMLEFATLLKGIEENNSTAFGDFLQAVSVKVSGQYEAVEAEWLAQILEKLGNDMMEHIRNTQWISDSKGNAWYNSYYDNHGDAVEGEFDGKVRMMLTGQVFAVMSGVAEESQIPAICKSADEYLYEKKTGGYRLNTNFEEEKYDMGRAFGFAYGEKENGAVFSHMAVMYAYALYARGFAKEGYKALQSLADTALDFDQSRIFPGIPEYFNSQGRGLYHYLTGAASWYALTMVTMVYGVRGHEGNLVLAPMLCPEQFDENGQATIALTFAGKNLEVTYTNNRKLSSDEYRVGKVLVDGNATGDRQGTFAVIDKAVLEAMEDGVHKIQVELM